MKIAVLSDIHGNLEALEAVLEDADRRLSPDDSPVLVALGDMVGYGADPEAVVRLVRGRGMRAVMGNHELGVTRPSSRHLFNPVALEAVLWTHDRLSEDVRRWLHGLPFFLSLGGCRFVHGLPPKNPARYLFETTRGEVAGILARLPETVCFVGHTHGLRLASLEPDGRMSSVALGRGVRNLAPAARHLVNAGAVGQPRDGDLKAKYLVYDTADGRLETIFVPYDHERAAAKIIAAGLPEVFARRLGEGRE